MAGGGAHLSSVLMLLPGAEAWVPLPPLPRKLVFSRASIVGNRLRVTGGFNMDDAAFRTEVRINLSWIRLATVQNDTLQNYTK